MPRVFPAVPRRAVSCRPGPLREASVTRSVNPSRMGGSRNCALAGSLLRRLVHHSKSRISIGNPINGIVDSAVYSSFPPGTLCHEKTSTVAHTYVHRKGGRGPPKMRKLLQVGGRRAHVQYFFVLYNLFVTDRESTLQ